MRNFLTILNRWLIPVLLAVILAFVVVERNWVSNRIVDLLQPDLTASTETNNIYRKDASYIYVQPAESFKPYSMQDLKNIYYTIIDNGWTTFSFYCPAEYEQCLDDVKTLSSDESLLSHINNFTHPYNNYSTIKTSYFENGEVTVKLQRLYSAEDIISVNKKADEIYNKVITQNMDNHEKIKALHDYIINNAKYDVEKANNGDDKYKSNTAYGIFYQGYGLCSGYADAMAIFLNKMGLENYKVASVAHVWNVVKLDGEWFHLDLTWDDPVSKDGTNNLWHKYFLIKKDIFKELDDADSTDHIFNTAVYVEAR